MALPASPTSPSARQQGNRGSKEDNDDFIVVASAIRSASTKASPSTSAPAIASDEKSASKKRKSAGESNTPKSLFPLFSKKKMSGETAALSSSHSTQAEAGAFVWLSPLGPASKPTCLRATFGRPLHEQVEKRKNAEGLGKVKVACFDLDGCLVVPRNGKSFPSSSDEYDYEETRRGVFKRVKEEYEKGACIAIVSNQKQTSPQSTALTPSPRLKTWKSKLGHIARVIDCPMIILAALSDDGFRKPGRAMWDAGIVDAYIEAGGRRQDIEVTSGGQVQDEVSYFVGDAAGRPQDHNDTDRKWASNVGIPFFTPEEYFDGKEPEKYKLSGWQPKSELAAKAEEGTSVIGKIALPSDSSKPEVVVFVGPPASGKTSYFRRYLEPHGYVWINQDTLKTAAKCQKAVKEELEKGKSVVVDNTNRNISTRAPYLALAKEAGAQIRCVHFDIGKDLAWHNNLFRARAGLDKDGRSLVPKMAFDSYYANVEIPKREEGFDEDIIRVAWSFDADADEETRRRWLCLWD